MSIVLVAIALGGLQLGEWSAPSCPSTLLVPRVRANAAAVRVSVREEGGVLVGSLEVERDGRTKRRTHQATSCAALIDVLALGVELAQSQEAKERVVASAPQAAEAAPEPDREPEPGPGPNAYTLPGPYAGPSPETVPAEPGPQETSPSPSAAPPLVTATPEQPPPSVPSLELGAHALVLFGPAPGALPGAELTGSWLPLNGAFRIELALQHARTLTLNLGPARGRFSLTTARLSACSPSVRIGPAGAALCGSVAAGATWAQGFASAQIETTQEVLLPWVDAAAQFRLSVPLPYGFRIDARLGPTFPITRHTFVFERPRIALHAVPVVGFEGGLGLSYAP